MEYIKRYKYVIAAVLPILILVLIRTFTLGHFKSDAIKRAEPSILSSNIISIEQSGNLPGDKLYINLDKESTTNNDMILKSINISAEKILNKNYFRVMADHKGPILLYSSEVSVTARIWMLLSQMGLENIYILSLNSDNEVIKYKFRPDTNVKPEL